MLALLEGACLPRFCAMSPLRYLRHQDFLLTPFVQQSINVSATHDTSRARARQGGKAARNVFVEPAAKSLVSDIMDVNLGAASRGRLRCPLAQTLLEFDACALSASRL